MPKPVPVLHLLVHITVTMINILTSRKKDSLWGSTRLHAIALPSAFAQLQCSDIAGVPEIMLSNMLI